MLYELLVLLLILLMETCSCRLHDGTWKEDNDDDEYCLYILLDSRCKIILRKKNYKIILAIH